MPIDVVTTYHVGRFSFRQRVEEAQPSNEEISLDTGTPVPTRMVVNEDGNSVTSWCELWMPWSTEGTRYATTVYFGEDLQKLHPVQASMNPFKHTEYRYRSSS